MKLGLDLAIAQYPPQFCLEAVVTASLPQGKAAAQSQRTRWEHGRLDLTRRYWPKLMALGLAQGRLGLIALALDYGHLAPVSAGVLLARYDRWVWPLGLGRWPWRRSGSAPWPGFSGPSHFDRLVAVGPSGPALGSVATGARLYSLEASHLSTLHG